MGNFAPRWAECRPKIAGFFRFLKDYKKRACNLPPGNLVEDAIQAWQSLSSEEIASYTNLANLDAVESESSEIPPHKPIRNYSAYNQLRCRPRMPKCLARTKRRTSCKPRRRKSYCKPKRKKKGCRIRRKAACKRKKPACKRKKTCKRKKASCSAKRKPACKRKKKPSTCKIKRKPSLSSKKFGFLSLFKRKACAQKPNKTRSSSSSSSGSCSKKKATKAPCKGGAKSAKKTFKCEKPGPVTSNGFLNFLREFRKKNCGLSPQAVLKKGARAWKKLSCEEKERYKKMGCGVTTSERRKKSPLCRK